MLRILWIAVFLIPLFCAWNERMPTDTGIYAYYTSIRSGEEFERHSRTGDYADIIVQIDEDIKMIFWRGSSYLPYLKSGDKSWYLDEIVPRSGDGSAEMPDRINRYSYVRIIENQPEKVVIHWRYVPDFSNPTFTGIVDEYFTFFQGGKLERRIRRGTQSIDDWNDPLQIIVQDLELRREGITTIYLNLPVSKRYPGKPRNIKPGTSTGPDDPLLHFGFNEGEGSSTLEAIMRDQAAVSGHKALWKKGVKGFALQFDGYYSLVEYPGYSTQDIEHEITVEGWIALGTYPFDWAPLVHQSTWEHRGFYLGINQDGCPGFHVALDDQWHTLESDTPLETFRWYCLTAIVESDGRINLYVDGKMVKSAEPGNGGISLSNSEVRIGLNREKMPVGPGRQRKGKYPSMFGVDGLIDEVRIFPFAKQPDEVANNFKSMAISDSTRRLPDMEPRHWPVMKEAPAQTGFGAQYTRLRYYETWDNMWRVSDHPDVVVTFDEIPGKIVSWRGLSNGPVLVTENNLWVGDQSSENYKELDAEGEAEGCCEHMSDKQCRHAHIRIIENTDARVVLHYRYGMVDSRYVFPDIDPETGWGDWADEIWTIYPDGVAVRYLERGMIWGDSWVETMFFSAPGQKPEDVVELDAFTVVYANSMSETWSWENDSPQIEAEDITITMVNSRSEVRAFNVYPSGSSVEVFGGHNRRSHFHWWNHWPVSQITSDGRGARAPDRAAHSSLVWGMPSQPFLMYGLTNKAPTDLLPLARSWNNPPKINKLTGAGSSGYDQKQRAYLLRNEQEKISFTLNGSENSPVLNPLFMVKNWKVQSHAEISVNGVDIPEGPYNRQGIIWDTDGSRTLLVWLKLQNEEKTEIDISGE
jgi:hypothetical protein